MTAKEKAEDLVNKFYSKTDEERVLVNKYWSNAKYCALIAVDEILKALSYQIGCNMDELQYYDEVKQNIEKL